MLLTEYRQFKVDKLLIEQSIKENKPLIVSGIIQRAEAKNQNGRVYPTEILKREIQNYIDGPIKERRATGELDHPESSVVNLKNVSHLIKEYWWDGDHVMGKIEILPTPSGNILKELIRAGVTLGVSSRGMGTLEQNGNVMEVQDDFELLCWDFVSTPSNPGSYMHEVIKEGKETKIYDYTRVNQIVTEILCSKGSCPIV